jgi:hypothetical protein
MGVADLTIDFTLSNLALFAIAGAFGGLLTGVLMKSAGWLILADLIFGTLGGLVGVYVVGALLHFDQYGLGAQALLALAGGVLTQVLGRAVIALRRRAKAAA